MPIGNEDNVGTMLDMLVYTNCLNVFTTAKMDLGDDGYNFSFTQLEEDVRIMRVSDMYDEWDNKEDIVDNEENKDEDDLSFHGDSSNMDSSESEVEISPQKKKRRILPPNLPFRLRRRGRYSMLGVRLFGQLQNIVEFEYICLFLTINVLFVNN